jgi:iron complex outermembrane receptor protein
MNVKLPTPRQRAISGLLLLVSGMSNCLAALDDFSEKSLIQDIPVVLSASRLSQPLPDAPNAVTVIDRTMIKASGARNIPDLLRLAPGMYVDYLNGNTPFVSYRGSTDAYTRRMQVLVDGRSVYLPPVNTVEWVDLPLHIDDIERIEVVRGPAATSYGSNSIFGVINITTLDASARNGASISLTRGSAGGGNGASDFAAHFGKSGDQLDYRLTLSAQNDNGLYYPANQWGWYGAHDDSHTTHQFNLRSNYHPNGVDSFDFQLGFNSSSRADGDPASLIWQPHRMKDRFAFQQLNWLHTLSPKDDIQLHYYHISLHSTKESTTLPVIGGLPVPATHPLYPLAKTYPVSDNTTVHRHELEMQHTAHTSPDNRIVWGMAMRHESADAAKLNAPQTLHQTRLFAHNEWRIAQALLLNAGAMLEDDGMGHKNTSPRVALNYHATPEHIFRASISVAYRNPAMVEEFGNVQYWVDGIYQPWHSTGGLRPERMLSREIGYLGNFSNGLSVDARVYNDNVTDIIWIDYKLGNPAALNIFGTPVPLVRDFRNEFAARYTGFEGTVNYRWEEKSQLSLNYSRQHLSCDPVGSPYLASTPLAPLASAWYASMVQGYGNTAPVNSGSVLYARQMGDGISLSAGYYQQGSVMVLDAAEPQPLSRRVDARLAKQFGQPDKIGSGEISLVVQNALQHRNIGYSGYSFDRRAYVTASFNF